jgi:hypothetical protein
MHTSPKDRETEVSLLHTCGHSLEVVDVGYNEPSHTMISEVCAVMLISSILRDKVRYWSLQCTARHGDRDSSSFMK